MFQLTPKRRENINKALLALIAVDLATLVFNPKGLIYLLAGVMIGFVSFLLILVLEK